MKNCKKCNYTEENCICREEDNFMYDLLKIGVSLGATLLFDSLLDSSIDLNSSSSTDTFDGFGGGDFGGGESGSDF